MNTKPPGPARTARTPENNARVSAALIRSPRRCARRHASELGLGRESVRSILQTDLRYNPYKLQVVQQLNVRDYARVDFAVRMQAILEENENAIIIMSDEAHFRLNNTLNKQNLHYWAPENPHNIHERPLHSACVTAWCAVAPFGVIGLYFFRGRRRNSDC